MKARTPEFVATPPQWPHVHLRPRSESEASRLMTVAPDRVIFVFGSNLAGKHIGGAAATALKYFGAEFGKGYGLRRQSYALPTMGYDLEQLPIEQVAGEVEVFLKKASGRADLMFYVTAIGTGIAGFTHEQIAPLFADAPNCLLPPEWSARLSTPVLTRKDA